ncbi:MAG: iron-siderophore ABC transporter substrate-binding protein [Acidimicrobiales bacterium]
MLGPHHRLRAFAVLVGLVVVACGGGATEASTDASPTPAPTPAADDASTAAPTATTPPSADPTTEPVSEPDEQPTAERIVVGDQAILDAALALELPIIGIPGYADREAIPSYLAERAANVEVLAERSEVNLEALAAARPDLLLFNEKLVEASAARDELAQIADLVELDVSTARPWRDVLREVAAAAGVPSRADARITEAEATIAEAREELGPEGLAVEVSVVRCFGPSCRYLPGGTSFPGQVLDDLGIARPQLQASDPEGRAFVEVSPERVDLLNGDLIVLLGTDAEDSIASLRDNPLWRQLDAVQAGAVYEVDGAAWFTGNVLALETIVDDIVRLLG